MRAAAPLALLLVLAACGATAIEAPGGDGGVPAHVGCGGKALGTPAGRPVAAACAVPSIPPGSGADGGLACAADADCAGDATHLWCRSGTCVSDQCSRDAECGSGQACACANEEIGNRVHTNVCVAAQCRVDSDCGPGQACSPTVQDLCSDQEPFFACHSSADSCRVDADCCSPTPACRYQPASGHWACVAACTYAG